MVFFWAGEVTETKAAVVKVPEGFVLNVCNATLAGADASAPVVSLGLDTAQMDKKPWKGVVAHLGAGTHQVKLDLVFGAAPQVKFYVAKGTGKVNLTGYFQPGPSAELPEATPAAAVLVATKTPSASNNKKRAREEPVTWDQTTSDSDDKSTAKAAEPQKQQKKQDKKPDQQKKQDKKPDQPKKQDKKPDQPKKQDKKPDQPKKQDKKATQDKKQETPVANGISASDAKESGPSKKKHRKQKKSNAANAVN